MKSFAELLQEIQSALGVKEGASWSLYDSDWREIYDLRTFNNAPKHLVYLEKAKAPKLPSIGPPSFALPIALHWTGLVYSGEWKRVPGLQHPADHALLPGPGHLQEEGPAAHSPAPARPLRARPRRQAQSQSQPPPRQGPTAQGQGTRLS